ncbi:MAG: glycosyl transferase family 2, partial [Solirubrobacterales bacterium]|nr:glycosyl transferase family 2 [Solirubrobacterales bacterium]
MPVDRPAADVIVPVAADAPRLRAVVERMRTLKLHPGDTLTIVDNRGVGVVDACVLVAADVATSYFARNAGAIRGVAPWIVFLDADVHPPPDLLDRLLSDPVPPATAGVLAGGVEDEPVGTDARAAARFAQLQAVMAHDSTLDRGPWTFAKTAHAAVRREAFEAVGGFRPGVRSGGDADLCWRVRDLGWTLETRPRATVVHASRPTVTGMLGQRFRHGSGAAWLHREHPGSLPPRCWPGLLWWGTRRAAAGARALAHGDRDAAVLGLLDGPAVWAF